MNIGVIVGLIFMLLGLASLLIGLLQAGAGSDRGTVRDELYVPPKESKPCLKLMP